MQTKGKRAKSAAKAGKGEIKGHQREGEEQRERVEGAGAGAAAARTARGPRPRLHEETQGRVAGDPDEGRGGIKRSSGAVGNCLGRLEKKEKVRLTDKKPRRYDLAGSKN